MELEFANRGRRSVPVGLGLSVGKLHGKRAVQKRVSIFFSLTFLIFKFRNKSLQNLMDATPARAPNGRRLKSDTDVSMTLAPDLHAKLF